MAKLLSVAALLLVLISARQFFDESIRCLGLEDQCEETPYDFKDDEVFAPCDRGYVEEEEYFVDEPDPFGDLESEVV